MVKPNGRIVYPKLKFFFFGRFLNELFNRNSLDSYTFNVYLCANKEEEILKTLILHQCNEMHKKFPFLFEDVKDDTIKMLFPQGLITTNSVLKNMLELDKLEALVERLIED